MHAFDCSLTITIASFNVLARLLQFKLGHYRMVEGTAFPAIQPAFNANAVSQIASPTLPAGPGADLRARSEDLGRALHR
jgi:hypothetical protein